MYGGGVRGFFGVMWIFSLQLYTRCIIIYLIDVELCITTLLAAGAMRPYVNLVDVSLEPTIDGLLYDLCPELSDRDSL